MLKKIIFCTALLTIIFTSASAPIEGRVKPRLVVNIVVSQMRYDYLLRYADNLSERGFRALINTGSSCDRASYNFLITSTPSGLATLSTGTQPSTHGIIGSQWFNYTTSQRVELLKDNKIRTIGADDYDSQLSPREMYASTLGDQIKSVSPYSKVISVAMDPMSAVIMGGYQADAAYWVNHREGKFVSNTYYMDKLPEWVDKFNAMGQAEKYSAEPWRVSRPTSAFHNVLRKEIILDTASNFFSFEWMTRKKWDFDRLKASPFGNTLVRDFAVQTVIYENLGKDDHTDLLNIVFDASRHIGEKYGTQSMEVEDCFYRMDAEIAGVLEFLTTQVGKEHLLVVITSDHGAADQVNESSKMPTGKFNAEQFAVLINGFVGAQLGGDKRWVLDFVNNQVYLDRKLIYQAGHNLEEIQNSIAGFAIQFRGVSQAVTSSSLSRGQFAQGIMGKAQNSYFPRHSGDVVLSLLPGWIVEQADILSNCGTSFNYDTHVPLIFWGGMIGSKDVMDEVDMTDVAPTIAHIIGIAPPNAATGKPVIEIYKK